MTFQVMAIIVTCAGCVLGIRFIFTGASVLKEWGIEEPLARLLYFAGLARSISASP